MRNAACSELCRQLLIAEELEREGVNTVWNPFFFLFAVFSWSIAVGVRTYIAQESNK